MRLAGTPLSFLQAEPADARLLPEGRMAGPMPWVIAIMMFLTALATATGLSLSSTARGLDADLAGRLTVQVVETNPEKREKHVKALVRNLSLLSAVETVREVPEKETAEMLRPWFGDQLIGQDVSIPALIDVTMRTGNGADLNTVRKTVQTVSTTARVDEHAQWLSPLAKLLGSLKWVSIMLVIMMGAAMGATVVLVARSALQSHRNTIEVMHLLGATDAQVATLFQRRIALDALLGSAIGLTFAVVTLMILKFRFAALGSEMTDGFGPGIWGWVLIIALPLIGAVLSTIAARVTVLNALRKML